jgi:hypothetical protein
MDWSGLHQLANDEIRTMITEQLQARINSNAVDGPKDLLLAVEMAIALDSREAIEDLLAKMVKFLRY